MQSKKIADIDTQVGAGSSRVEAPARREFRGEPDEHWGPVVGHLNGLGPALIEIYEAGGEHPIKIELLDQIVSIVRRKKTSDERVREIAILMRDWQQMRRS